MSQTARIEIIIIINIESVDISYLLFLSKYNASENKKQLLAKENQQSKFLGNLA